MVCSTISIIKLTATVFDVGRKIYHGGIIRHGINNLFAGISSYDADGMVGPGNVLQYNGNTGEIACSELSGPGGGDGGVAVRDLDVSDTLIVSGNVIMDIWPEEKLLSAIKEGLQTSEASPTKLAKSLAEESGWSRRNIYDLMQGFRK